MAKAKVKEPKVETVEAIETVEAEAPESVETCPANSKKNSYAGTYTVAAPKLNVREGAGMDSKILAVVNKGTKMQNEGYYTKLNGVVWLYVTFKTAAGAECAGFVNAEFVKK